MLLGLSLITAPQLLDDVGYSAADTPAASPCLALSRTRRANTHTQTYRIAAGKHKQTLHLFAVTGCRLVFHAHNTFTIFNIWATY